MTGANGEFAFGWIVVDRVGRYCATPSLTHHHRPPGRRSAPVQLVAQHFRASRSIIDAKACIRALTASSQTKDSDDPLPTRLLQIV
jgi:hypothetical protein